MYLYAITIFLGAFLLFQVQPLIGKFVLPWFGGGPGVWTTCMLFFQLLLLAGYAYAHFLGSGSRPKKQALVHGIVLGVAVLALPNFIPHEAWKPAGDANPTLGILLLLAACVGLPYFVLSTTGPLLQRWFSLSHPGVSPYRLYALSNLGSLLALISYPFLFEPALSRKQQALTWSAGMVVFAILCGMCAWRLRQVDDRPAGQSPETPGGTPIPAVPTSIVDRIFWLLLPACASVMLLATTNKMCQDVAVIPFLWVLPLSLYLLSFIISFDSPRWYSRRWFGAAFILSLAGVGAAVRYVHDVPLVLQVIIYCSSLFVFCMCAHGEVYRLRPDPRFLTGYYLTISCGGALGGLLVALVAPFVFRGYYEFHVGVVLTGIVYVAVLFRGGPAVPVRDEGGRRWLPPALQKVFPFVFLGMLLLLGAVLLAAMLYAVDGVTAEKVRQPVTSLIGAMFGDLSRNEILHLCLITSLVLFAVVVPLTCLLPNIRRWYFAGTAGLLLAVIVSAAVLRHEIKQDRSDAIATGRNFYGTLAVFEYGGHDELDNYYLLQHGQITHGMQLRHPTYRRWPTTYYGEGSGVGMAVKKFPRQQGQRIGVVGLGTGSMAVYAKEGDYLRIYEINPMVEDFAHKHFSYVTDTPAEVDIVMGDARLSMEREEPQQLDFIVLDAFSSDAIPVHLLTKESFEIYRRNLKPDGVVAVHISNRHLDLEPVVLTLAGELGYKTAIIENNDGDNGHLDEDESAWWIYTAIWILVTNNEELLNHPDIVAAAMPPRERKKPIRLWTDDYTALYEVLDPDSIPSWRDVKRWLKFRAAAEEE